MDEMVRGYIDGADPNSPTPSENRTKAYRHGFANARDDMNGQPRATAAALRRQANLARIEDDT